MSFVPILVRRRAHDITITNSSTTKAYSAWPAVGVDYGNEGADDDPPTLTYVNEVDHTIPGAIVLALPLSAEGFEPPTPGAGGGGFLPQFRRPLAIPAGTRVG